MYDFLCLFCQTKHHIKILTAVTFAAKQTYFFQQGLLKHGKMANVIIRPQIVNGKIWLKMGNRDIFCRTLKSQLIRVNKICSLFTDRFHIFIKHRRMQQIIVVKLSDIVPGSHLDAGIGISGNSQIFFQLSILNAAVLLLEPCNNLPHLPVFVITTVSQA